MNAEFAEKQLLGNLILNSNNLVESGGREILEEFEVANFSTPKHRLLFQVLQQTYQACDNWDIVTVIDTIKDMGESENITDEYLFGLTKNSHGINTRAWAQAVENATTISSLTSSANFSFKPYMTPLAFTWWLEGFMLGIGDKPKQADWECIKETLNELRISVEAKKSI